MSVVLETRKLTKIYGKRLVVNEVDFSVNRGEIVGLLGKNGAGKTTSFQMTIGMIRPNAGRVIFNGEDVTQLPMFKRARKGMGYLPQEPSTFLKLSVEDNMLAILETMKLSRSDRKRLAQERLEEMGLWRLKQNKAYTLSGGERRRLEIARALLTSPQILLLDEPFSGIDPIAVYDIQRIIVDLKTRRRIGILLTDHNVWETLAITDRSYIINEGSVLISGSSQELVENKIARKYYLGDKFQLTGSIGRHFTKGQESPVGISAERAHGGKDSLDE